MARPVPKVLFLSHAATRNGASILLLHTMRWLRQQVDWEFDVLFNGKGPLLDDFRSIAGTRVHRNPFGWLDRLFARSNSSLASHVQALCAGMLLRGRRFDLIYANTAATWREVQLLGHRAPSLLWHIHEMEYALRVSMGSVVAIDALKCANRFVAVSEAVQRTLSQEFSLPTGKIDVIPGFVEVPDLGMSDRIARRRGVMARLGWPEGAFVVGGCGSPGWRKGTDIFVQIVKAVQETRHADDFRFVWVGGATGSREFLEFEQDIKLLGLQDRCRLVPSTADVSDYYCAMDVFALTSREDPFPLVMLEAGAHGVPLVCFAASGGGPEFAQTGGGLVAPYLDVGAFAAHLLELHGRQDLRARLGASARSAVLTAHVVETQGPLLLQSMRDCLQPAA